MNRDERQQLSKTRWRQKGGRGTLVGATGFGKTRVATNTIISMNEAFPLYTTDVVVPSINLKEDWLKKGGHIEKYRLKNVEVFTIHTYIKYKRNPNLLVLDEIHNFAADTFRTVFDIVEGNPYILGLTADFERADGKHSIIEENAPVFDVIPLQECISNGWVSDYIAYNLGVDLTDEDRIKEKEINDAFNNYFAKFESDFDLFNACRGSLAPRFDGESHRWYEPPQVRYARKKGWNGITLEGAVQKHREQKLTRTRGNVWTGDDEFEFSPRKVSENAQKCAFYMNERQDFLHNALNKRIMAVEVVKRFKEKKIIIFTERKVTCDDITERLRNEGIRVTSYHSDINTEVYSLGKLVALGEKVKSGNKEITRYRNLEDGKLYTEKEIKGIYGKITKLGKDRLKKIRAEQFNSGEKNVLVTVKALDEGMNVEDVEIGINVAAKSVSRQENQRRGRILRFIEGKMAWFINLYVKDSKDFYWLKSRQSDSKRPIWIDSINEIGMNEEKVKLW
jgi:superfamily II DNA or RNA helicase